MRTSCSLKLTKAVEMLNFTMNSFNKTYVHFLRFAAPENRSFAEFLDSWKIALLRLGFRPLLCWYLNLCDGSYSVILFTNAYVSEGDMLRLRDATERVWHLYSGVPCTCMGSFLVTPAETSQIIRSMDEFIDAADGDALRPTQHIRTFGASAF